MKPAAVLLAVSMFAASSAHAQERWPDTFESRVEILALLQSVNGEILASSSATRTLEAWCGEHHMAADPKIAAARVATPAKQPSPDQLQRLGVRDASEVRYRHVELRCGAHVLSEADNWYVPARLTAEMNEQLDSTETPFGKVVRPLDPYRRTIAVTMLWSPLPRGWEQQPRRSRSSRHPQTLQIPRDVFQHRALLYTAAGVPFAEVVETYRGELLAFGR